MTAANFTSPVRSAALSSGCWSCADSTSRSSLGPHGGGRASPFGGHAAACPSSLPTSTATQIGFSGHEESVSALLAVIEDNAAVLAGEEAIFPAGALATVDQASRATLAALALCCRRAPTEAMCATATGTCTLAISSRSRAPRCCSTPSSSTTPSPPSTFSMTSPSCSWISARADCPRPCQCGPQRVSRGVRQHRQSHRSCDVAAVPVHAGDDQGQGRAAAGGIEA